jgi:hypothetical protein
MPNYLIGLFIVCLIASMILVRQASIAIVGYGGIPGGLVAIALVFTAGYFARPYLD